MSINQYTKEQLRETSFIEVAYELLEEKKEAVPFKELVNEIVGLLGIPKSEVSEKMVQFYTDLNIDGRFLGLGDNRWGLRFWYPVDHVEEEVAPVVKPRKKKAKKVVEEDEIFDDIEEEELEFDDFEEDDLAEDDEEDFDEDAEEVDEFAEEIIEDDEEELLIEEDDDDDLDDEESDLDKEKDL
ncbi:DNA-directed RNA polymerase subunit delta [Mesobacillus zeae]|uniref:Probable DNA-directed RNA polymerase subunit delta n=1 Tax=Mesobacillus zeae TaxID=1917180 RepID=A0A398BAM5_9BACI|nr:DNA-directed RNA polymerase subunit delta [Mesobacillus zeae]RID86877.1 DNA-directed RNA polymerase subunit delta [Mesobacillus zeae]